MKAHHKLTRRDFIISAGATLAGTALAACSLQPTDEPAAPTQVSKEPVTVTVAYWAVEAHMVGMNQVVDAFNAAHPDITMEVLVPPVGEYFQKLLSMYAGGEGPDILYTPGYWFPTALSKNVVRDVDEYIQRDGWNTDMYYSVVLDSFKSDGKVYGVPWVWATNHIFWNKTLFDELGVEYPATSLDDDSWTWDKFVEVSKQLTTVDDSGAPATFGFNLPIKHWSWPRILTWENGGGILSEDMKQCIVNHPESVEALQWAVDLQRVHGVLPTVAGGVGTDIPNFQTGKIGMDLTAAPVISAWWDLDFEWDVAHNPIGPEGQSCTLSPEAFVMAKDCEHPDEAWEVLKFLGSAEAQEIQARNMRSMPAVVSVAEGDTFLPADKPPMHKEVLWETLEYAREPVYPPFWGELRTIIANEIEPAFYEGKDVQAAADAMCEQVETLIAEAE